MHSIRHPEAVTCPGLQARDFAGPGISIAHIDTGYGGHDEIEQGSCDPYAGYDLIRKQPGGWEPANSGAWSHGHGDSTGSVIVSRAPNYMRGVATSSVTVPYRAVTFVAIITGMGRVAKAINMAAGAGRPVISMSLGGLSLFSGLENQLRKAERSGSICVAAAGNCVGFAVAPAISNHCIGVSGTAPDDRPWRFASSSKNGRVDIAAPAQWVQAASHKTTRTDKLSERGEGTSYATAMTAGAAAMWLGYHGERRCRAAANESQLPLGQYFKALIKHTARVPSGWDPAYGQGILDICELLRLGLPVVATPRAPTLTPTTTKARIRFEQFVREVRPDRINVLRD